MKGLLYRCIVQLCYGFFFCFCFFNGNLLISEQNDTVKTIILPPTLAKRHLSYAP